MQDRASRTERLDTLIAHLSEAARGSAGTDAEIAYNLGTVGGDCRRAVDMLARQGFAWSVIANLWDADIPAYSRSLDAALPGENIVATVFEPARNRWAAVQRTTSVKGVVGWGATEALARRLAALKAMRETAQAADSGPADSAPADDVMPRSRSPVEPLAATLGAARGVDADRRRTERAAEKGKAERGEWKILF